MISKMFKNYKERTEKHIENVKKVCDALFDDEVVKEYLDDLGIEETTFKSFHISKHDSSKFGIEEMLGYILMTEKYGRKVGYKFSKEDDDIMAKAWDHHKSVNRHHPEFFEDVEQMKQADLLEMCCDWGAMSLEFGDSVVDFMNNKAFVKYPFTTNQKGFIIFICEKIDELLKENRM